MCNVTDHLLFTDVENKPQLLADEAAAILERLSEGLCILDKSWRFCFANKAFSQFIGQPSDIFIGKVIWDVFPQLAHTEIQNELLQAMHIHEERKFIAFLPAARQKRVLIRAYPERGGLTVYMCGLDSAWIANHPLVNFEEQFNKLFETNPCSLSITRCKDWRMIRVNKAWERCTGYRRAEAIGRTRHELGLIIDCDSAQQAMLKVMAEGRIECLHTEFRHRSGDIRTVLLSAEHMVVDGEPAVLWSVIDMTDRIRFEAEIGRLDRLNLIGEMAASIGHEVRNPLTTVRGFLQMLRGKTELGRYSDHFDIMVEELDRANAIISEFLSLAKHKSITLKKANLASVINTLLPLLQANALMAGKLVHYEGESIPDIMMDENDIRQLVLNLVKNGLEAMPGGGSVFIRTFHDHEQVILEIRDMGTGIPPAIQSKLGTPFFTTKEKGTGVGLAVCYNIAHRHQSTVDFRTGQDGTTFFVRFPSAKDPV